MKKLCLLYGAEGFHGGRNSLITAMVLSSCLECSHRRKTPLYNTRWSLCDLPRVKQGVYKGVHSMAQTCHTSLGILVLQKRLSRATWLSSGWHEVLQVPGSKPYSSSRRQGDQTFSIKISMHSSIIFFKSTKNVAPFFLVYQMVSQPDNQKHIGLSMLFPLLLKIFCTVMK